MSAENQEVNMEFGFALRGERSVERGLDSIIERFARTGSVAELAGASLERFGRVFEAGLPIALGAAALGQIIGKLSELNEKTSSAHSLMEKMAGVDFHNESLKNLTDDFGKATEALEKFNEQSGFSKMAEGAIGFLTGAGDPGANLRYAVDRSTWELASKQAEDLDAKTKYLKLETSGHADQARIEKIRDDEATQIADLTKAGLRISYVPIHKMLTGGWESAQIIGYRQQRDQLNQPQIDALRRYSDAQVNKITDGGWGKKTEARDAGRATSIDRQIEEGHAKADEKRHSNLEAFLKGNEQDAKSLFDQLEQAGDQARENGEISRLQRREKMSGSLENLNENIPANKVKELTALRDFDKQNVAEDNTEVTGDRKRLEAFQTRTAGRSKTALETQEGARLEAALNDATKRLLEDRIELHGADKNLNSAVQKASEFHKSDVVASSGRKVGGGGNTWSPHGGTQGGDHGGGVMGNHAGNLHHSMQELVNATNFHTDILKKTNASTTDTF
jgi:hypothetical protein